MADVEAGRVVVRFEGKDYGLSQLISQLDQKMNQTVSSAKTMQVSLEQVEAEAKRLNSETLALGSALNTYHKAQGNAVQGAKEYASALSQVTPGTLQYAQGQAFLQQQLAAIEKQQQRATSQAQAYAAAQEKAFNRQQIAMAKANQASSSLFTNMASGFNKLIGLGFALQTGFNIAGGLIQQANEAEKVNATFKALSGTAEQYEKNLAIAKKQQDLFGGSLKENQEDLSGFIYTARQAGVSVEQLANVARKLAIVDPAQG